MTDTPTANPQMQAWLQELATTGRISIRTARREYWIQFGVPLAIAIAVFVIAYAIGEITLAPMIIAMVLSSVVLLGIALYLSRRNGGKEIVIDERGLTTLTGQFIPWDQIEEANVFKSARSAPVVYIVVSERAWDEHNAASSRSRRALNNLNRAYLRKRAIFFPSQLDPDEDDLAGLITFFATGTPAT